MFLSKLALNIGEQLTHSWMRNPYRVHQRLWMAFGSEERSKPTRGSAPFLFSFEIVQKRSDYEPRILIISQNEPDWSRAFRGNFEKVLILTPKVRNIDFLFDPHDPVFQKGRIFRFSLRANPVRKVKDYATVFQKELQGISEPEKRRELIAQLTGSLTPEQRMHLPQKILAKRAKDRKYGRVRSKKVGIYREPELEHWINRKGEQHGFQILETEIAGPDASSKKALPNLLLTGSGILKATKKSEESVHSVKIHVVTFSGLLRVTDPEKFQHAYINGIGSGKAFGCGMLLVAPA